MNGKSSAELEREAETARANVAETADAIRSKLTPGQMIDEFTGMFAGGDGKSALNNLKTQITNNPLPLTLVGAGLAWLMLGSGTPARKSSDAQEFGGISRSKNMDRGSRSAEDQSTGGLADTTDRRPSAVSSKAGEYMDAATETIGIASSRAAEAANSLTRQAGDIASKSKSTALDIFEKEPLLLAAFGLAVGTAVGVMLPHSELEDDQLGSASKRIRAKAEELLDESFSQAKDLAAGAYQTLKDEADHQGLGSEGSVVVKVSDVVRSTAQKTEDAVRSKLKDT